MSHSTHLKTLARRLSELASVPYSKALERAQNASSRKQLILPLTSANIEKNARRLASKIDNPSLSDLTLGFDQSGTPIKLALNELSLHLLATGPMGSGLGSFNARLAREGSDRGWDTILISSTPQGGLPLGRHVNLESTSLWSSLNREQLLEAALSLLLPMEPYLGRLLKDPATRPPLNSSSLTEVIPRLLKGSEFLLNGSGPSVDIAQLEQVLSQKVPPFDWFIRPGHTTFDLSGLDESSLTKEINALLVLMVAETKRRMLEFSKKPNRLLVVVNPYDLTADHLTSSLLSRARAARVTVALTGNHPERPLSPDITNNIGSLLVFGGPSAGEPLLDLSSRFGTSRTSKEIESLKPGEYYFSNIRTGTQARISPSV